MLRVRRVRSPRCGNGSMPAPRRWSAKSLSGGAVSRGLVRRSEQWWRCCFSDYIRKVLFCAMEVDLIFKVAAVGILVAVLNILLSRSGRDEQALMVTLAGLMSVLVIIVREISDLFALIKELFGL